MVLHKFLSIEFCIVLEHYIVESMNLNLNLNLCALDHIFIAC